MQEVLHKQDTDKHVQLNAKNLIKSVSLTRAIKVRLPWLLQALIDFIFENLGEKVPVMSLKLAAPPEIFI